MEIYTEVYKENNVGAVPSTPRGLYVDTGERRTAGFGEFVLRSTDLAKQPGAVQRVGRLHHATTNRSVIVRPLSDGELADMGLMRLSELAAHLQEVQAMADEELVEARTQATMFGERCADALAERTLALRELAGAAEDMLARGSCIRKEDRSRMHGSLEEARRALPEGDVE